MSANEFQLLATFFSFEINSLEKLDQTITNLIETSHWHTITIDSICLYTKNGIVRQKCHLSSAENDEHYKMWSSQLQNIYFKIHEHYIDVPSCEFFFACQLNKLELVFIGICEVIIPSNRWNFSGKIHFAHSFNSYNLKSTE